MVKHHAVPVSSPRVEAFLRFNARRRAHVLLSDGSSEYSADGSDAHMERTCRRFDDHFVIDVMAQHCSTSGRLVRDQPMARVRLDGADDAICPRLVV